MVKIDYPGWKYLTEEHKDKLQQCVRDIVMEVVKNSEENIVGTQIEFELDLVTRLEMNELAENLEDRENE